MKLTVEKNHKVIKTTEHPELKRLFELVNSNVNEILKGFAYDGIKSEISLYNTFEEVERKLKIFGCVHCATIRTENEKIEIFIKR